jgi:hypothetical protein
MALFKLEAQKNETNALACYRANRQGEGLVLGTLVAATLMRRIG